MINRYTIIEAMPTISMRISESVGHWLIIYSWHWTDYSCNWIPYGCIQIAYYCNWIPYGCVQTAYYCNLIPYSCVQIAYYCNWITVESLTIESRWNRLQSNHLWSNRLLKFSIKLLYMCVPLNHRKFALSLWCTVGASDWWGVQTLPSAVWWY